MATAAKRHALTAETLDPSMRPASKVVPAGDSLALGTARPAHSPVDPSRSVVPDVPAPRAGVDAVRALRELALARIEISKARFAPPAEASALRDAASARLAAIEKAPRPLAERHSEVRRVSGRVRAALRRGRA